MYSVSGRIEAAAESALCGHGKLKFENSQSQNQKQCKQKLLTGYTPHEAFQGFHRFSFQED